MYTLQDLLSLRVDGHFESQFFSFRCKVQRLEKQLGQELGAWLHRSPSLQAQLRIMEMFQCVSRREAVRVSVCEQDRFLTTTCLSLSPLLPPPYFPLYHFSPTSSAAIHLSSFFVSSVLHSIPTGYSDATSQSSDSHHSLRCQRHYPHPHH